MTDIDGNVYPIVQIDDQWWMAENLKTTRYNNNTPIEYPGTDNEAWDINTTGAYAGNNNDYDTYGTIYGALYNWHAVNTGRLCPTGWHVPTDEEWTLLTNYLGGERIAGGKMKTTGTIEGGDGLWYDPITGATNETGWSALPGGVRFSSGGFDGIGYTGVWWSSTEYVPDSFFAWSRFMSYNSGFVSTNPGSITYGYSVRCVKD